MDVNVNENMLYVSFKFIYLRNNFSFYTVEIDWNHLGFVHAFTTKNIKYSVQAVLKIDEKSRSLLIKEIIFFSLITRRKTVESLTKALKQNGIIKKKETGQKLKGEL